MDVMSVQYLVSDRPVLLPRLERVDEGESGRERPAIWRNPGAMPRAYVVPRAAPERGPDGEAHAGWISMIDLHQAVVMQRDPLGPDDRNRQPFTPAQWIGHDPDEPTIRVTTEAPGLLVVGNTWVPGWTAIVDGAPATVQRGNGWQQVIPLPKAGNHEIRLRFDPPGLYLGWAITGGAISIWAGLGMAALIRLGYVNIMMTSSDHSRRLTRQKAARDRPGRLAIRPSHDACG